MAFTPANTTVPSGSISDHYREQLFLKAASYEAPMPDPTTAPTAVAASGLLPPGRYRFAYAWVNGNGESRVSPAAGIVLTVPSQVTVTPPADPSGVTAVNIYMDAPSVIPGVLVQVSQAASGAVVVNALPAPPYATEAPGQGNGSSSDFNTNARFSGPPSKAGRNRDATAYSTQATADSWTVWVRERGNYV